MLPKIFFLTEKRSLYVKYKTKEEFYEIKSILKRFGCFRGLCSGTRYIKGGVFHISKYKLPYSKFFTICYYCEGPSQIKFADYTVQNLYKLFKMSIIEQLKKYFEKTPKEQLEKDWDEIKVFNNIGPSVEEYVEFIKQKYGSDKRKSHKEDL